jgi:DNA-directed DNA polymerase III PolC
MYGTLSIETLVGYMAENKFDTAVLTDINNTSGAWDYVRVCRDAGLRPLLGIDFRNMEANTDSLYIGIAKDNEGFMELNIHLSDHLHSEKPFSSKAPVFQKAFVIYPYRPGIMHALRENEFAGIRPQDFNRLIREDAVLLKKKAVTLAPLSFGNDAEDYYLHCLLRAVDRNTLLSKLEKKYTGTRYECAGSIYNLLERYKEYPYIISNTQNILEQCTIDFDFKAHKNKKFFCKSAEEDRELFYSECMEGLEKRYNNDAGAKARLLHEIDVIHQLQFTSYFLMVWDVIKYAKHKGYYYVGRGSGANSIAAYCLEITDVDPIALNLYFERFLNLHRNSPPDFDIDFSWTDRDDIIDYLFRKHGARYTAMLGSHSTFKFRAIARELGKVYGLPKHEIDTFIGTIELDKYTGEKKSDGLMDKYKAKIKHFAGKLNDKFPHYLSVHACGLVVSDAPMHYFTATQIPPKGFPITHFDMYTADKMQLHKLDILSQRGLGHIRDCIEIVQKNRNEKIDIRRVKDFIENPYLNDLLKEGKTIGCFYIESPAMRQLMRKLNCADYPTLVAASSIIRPGVSDSGMARAFVERHNKRSYTSIHPKLDDILGDTYGVMVYQEDVIKVAHLFAGLSLAEADMLRRAMAWKFRVDDGFKKMEKKYFISCRDQGYPFEIAIEIWRQMESFAGFSFCKAHSASYAVESYQSLFLKAYYPMEFMVAVINNFGGYYNTEFYVNEARRAGANIHSPCVNRSEYNTLIEGIDIYLGFIHIKSLETEITQKIQVERAANGDYISLEDFCERIKPGMEQLFILVKIGALRFTGRTKKQLLFDSLFLYGNKKKPVADKNKLFSEPALTFHFPPVKQSIRENALQEIELLGFPLCSRFELLTTAYRGDIKARDMINNIKQSVTMVGYLTNTKTSRTKHGEYMQFGSFMDDENDNFEAVLFPAIFRQLPLIDKAIYALHGKITEDFGVASLEVQSLERLEISFDSDEGSILSQGIEIIEKAGHALNRIMVNLLLIK